ncbi:hypothetical protein KUV85_07915 [Nocardioides panacisoli]|uniref:hypothetical protein n=1 Tax=Nocardioides panacisoli TaxID=627624 RepID=UPI001C638602|nr:hypothetical protein [Nocardioides panacisoli]QYJ05591.1 hypothetical protein KUV85_07915 [Nocardioides panacisoli]
MQYSPKGRFIQYVEGSAGDIIERGEAITVLGDQMLDSADVLERIKNNAMDAGGQKGQAIEKLRESIGDSYATLREAGNLYQPVGPVISTYGQALDSVQPLIKAAVDDSHDLWDTYMSLPGQVEPRGTGGLFQPDEGSPEAADQAAEDAAKKAAYDAWEARTEDFDSHYDTWEDAFDTAVTGVSDELSGAIEDSFWDNFGDVINVLTEILSWAALIVGIVALFAGGWILALAAVLALAAFALTAVKFANGQASGWDLAFAALAIIPVGKVTNLTKFAQFPQLMRGAGGTSNALGRTWKVLSKGPIEKLASNAGKSFQWLPRTQVMDNLVGKSYSAYRTANISLYVGNRALLESRLPLVRALSGIDRGAGLLGAMSSHYGRVATAVNNTTSVDIGLPKPVGVFI